MTKGVAYTETAGTLTNTTVAITANPNRKGLIVANPSDTVMTLRVGGTASATAGIPVAAGGSFQVFGENCPSGALSLFCAGTTKAYTIYELIE